MNRYCILATIMVALLPVSLYADSSEALTVQRLRPDRQKELTNGKGNASAKQLVKNLLKDYRSRPNMYFNLSDGDVAAVKQRFPNEVATSIQTADQVINHYFLFRYDWDMEKTNIPVQFKGDIEWAKVPFGDPEWCFMLNRHRYWVDLGKAYFITKNEKYAKTWVEQVTDWIKKNPLEEKSLRGLTWRRIEAGIRCENWIKSWEYFKNSKSITPEFFSQFLNSLYQHAEYINSGFNNHSKISNWGILEFQGLFNVAAFMTDFDQSETWRKSATEKLDYCASIQVLPDGTQWEQSPMYHNEVFHCLMNVVLLGKTLNISIPESIEKKVFDMAWANVQWQKPNYHQPLIGDSDDTDLRGILTLAAYLYNDGGLKSRAYSELDYESLFILGENRGKLYAAIPSQAPQFLSYYQPSSGDMFMRSSWDKDASYLHFDMKMIGCGHAHDDLLHISLFAHNRDYLVDGGRYTYVESDKRKFFKMSTGHNGLGVDDLTNSVYSSSWDSKFNAKSEGLFTKITPLFDYAEAQNIGYHRLEDPVTTKRRVLYLKPDLWLLFDSFRAKESHKYSLFFNFPNKKVNADANKITTTYGNDDLVIEPIKKTNIMLVDSHWSPEYNLLEKNTKAEIFSNVKGAYSFITALYFSGQKKVSFTRVPVFDRNDIKLDDTVVEAVEIKYGDKEFVVMVVNNNQSPKNPFYKVKDLFVTGEVVLLERVNGSYIPHTIKE